MAVLSAMVFAVMYLTKATTIFMNIHCNEVSLMCFADVAFTATVPNCKVTIQTGTTKGKWGWSEGLQPPHFLVLLVSKKRFDVDKMKVCLRI